MRRDQANQHAAQRASRRHHQIKVREIFRVRFEARQFAMACHATEKQPDGKERDKEDDLGVFRHGGPQQICHAAQRNRQQLQIGIAPIPIALETENKAQQINAERQNPKKRNGGDVLRKVVGDGQQ